MSHITILTNGTTIGDWIRVKYDDHSYDYSWGMMNPYQLAGLLQDLGHDVTCNHNWDFEVDKEVGTA